MAFAAISAAFYAGNNAGPIADYMMAC